MSADKIVREGEEIDKADRERMFQTGGVADINGPHCQKDTLKTSNSNCG